MPGAHHLGHSHGLGWHIHRGNKSIDSKSKILILIFNTFILTFLISFELIFLFGLLLLLLTYIYRANVLGIVKKFIVTLPLLLSLTFLVYFAYPNQGILSFGKTLIHYSRFEIIAFYLLKTFLFIYNALILIESEDSFLEVIYAFESLKMPQVLVNVLFFMYRSTIDMQQETERMLEARYIRSYGKPFGSNLRSYKLIGFMIGGILTRTLLKNNQLKDALIIRGYDGTLHHSKVPWSFQGLRLLWFTLLINVLLLLFVRVKFLPLGAFV